MKIQYSTVFTQSADEVWAIIRDFNSYPVWVKSVSESRIEEGRSGDAVGCIRNFVEYGTRIRQRLLAHSDLERSYTYKSCEPLGSIAYYQGTARIIPIIDGNRSLVEWSIIFDSAVEQQTQNMALLKEAIPQWLESLRVTLETGA